MSNTKRPTVQRKHTRGTEAKRNAALDEGIRIELDGEVYEVRAGDLTALDSLALRRECGMPFAVILSEIASDRGDIDLIAAIMWLARRRKGEVTLTYNEVAADVRYDVLDRMDVKDPEPEDTDSPEARGGRS